MHNDQIDTTTATPALARATFDREPLLAALDLAAKVTERRNTIPILSNVLFDVMPGGVRILSTDLDIQILHNVAADVASPGRFTVPLFTLHDLVKRAEKGAVIALEDEGERLKVTHGRGAVTVPTLPCDDFPVIAFNREACWSYVLPARQMADDMKLVRPAISTEETRYYLNGIFMEHAPAGEGGPDVLTFVATDGHRLHRVRRLAGVVSRPSRPDNAPQSWTDATPGILLHRKTVKVIIDAIGKREFAEAAIYHTASKYQVDLGDIVITSKLIDGTFPDYHRVIPTANDKIVTLDPVSLQGAAGRVSSIAREKTRAIKAELSGDLMTVSCMSPENGVATEQMAVDYKGPRGAIGFNFAYLGQIAGLVKAERLVLAIADGSAPALFTWPDAPHLDAVLMPMRVADGPDMEFGGAPSCPAARFELEFGKAYKARDREAMRTACQSYRDAKGYEGAEGAAELCVMAAKVKGRGLVRRRHRADFTSGGVQGTWAHFEHAVSRVRAHKAWRDALPGWHVDDPRDLLPVDVEGARGSVYVLKADLVAFRGAVKVYKQDGSAVERGRGNARARGHFIATASIKAVKPGRNSSERRIIADAIAAAADARSRAVPLMGGGRDYQAGDGSPDAEGWPTRTASGWVGYGNWIDADTARGWLADDVAGFWINCACACVYLGTGGVWCALIDGTRSGGDGEIWAASFACRSDAINALIAECEARAGTAVATPDDESATVGADCATQAAEPDNLSADFEAVAAPVAADFDRWDDDAEALPPAPVATVTESLTVEAFAPPAHLDESVKVEGPADNMEGEDVAAMLRRLSGQLDGMATRIEAERTQAVDHVQEDLARVTAERDALQADLVRARTAKARLVRWGAGVLGRMFGLRRRLAGAEAESKAARDGLRMLSGRVEDMQARLDGREASGTPADFIKLAA